MHLKLLSVASATLLLSLVSIHGASAEGGCGPGFHRGPYGGCQPRAGCSRTWRAGCGSTGSRGTADRLRRWLPLASEVQALRGPLNSAPHLY